MPESLSAGCASRCLYLVKDGLPVLGALLSRDPAFSSNWFQRRVSESHARLFELLGNRILPTHHAFTLLRSAILPRLSFLSRVVPPEILLPTASWFDDLIRSIFCERLRLSDLSEDLALRVSLPVRLAALACVLLFVLASSPSSLSSVAPSSSSHSL